MRLLVLNPDPVLPAQSGGQQAVLGLASALAAQAPLELVWTERHARPPAQQVVAGATLSTRAFARPWLQRHVARWLKPALGRVDTDIGAMLASAGNGPLVRHLRERAEAGTVFVLSHPWLWPALSRALQGRRALVVYDSQNVEHLLKGESYPRNALAARVVQRVRALEAALVRRADLVLACTRRDAQALAALGGVGMAKLHVGSKGIAPSAAADAVAAARATRAPARVAVFVGADHGPNNEAARWILQTLAPACPEWRFDIAGACGPAAGVAPSSANVRVLGRVAELLPVLADAGVALNPVVAGSGINMKLFEYLQCGLPVLCTGFGARGFEGLASCGLEVVEREGFAAALQALAADPARLLERGAQGRAAVRDHFSWPAIGAQVFARIQALQTA